MIALIGITGHMQAGKDTIASYLAPHGYMRFALADPLKELATRIGWDGTKRAPEDYPIPLDDGDGPPSDKCRFWPGAFNGRLLLQELGVGCRELLESGVWVMALRHRLGPVLQPYYDLAVVTDVRFKNEAKAIVSWGGVVWKVVRPGFDGDGSDSEREVDEIQPDLIISNHSGLEALRAEVEKALTVQDTWLHLAAREKGARDGRSL